MNVELTPEELALAATIGVNRHIRAIQKKRKDRYGYDGPDWAAHIEGALAECAVAKALDRYWTDTPKLDHGGDVGDLHVRGTPRPNGCLLLHPDDPDQGVFILATGAGPHWRLRGWLRAGEGKREQWWRTDIRHPAFLVPQGAINPMGPLP